MSSEASKTENPHFTQARVEAFVRIAEEYRQLGYLASAFEDKDGANTYMLQAQMSLQDATALNKKERK